jgi:TPR repeat protein
MLHRRYSVPVWVALVVMLIAGPAGPVRAQDAQIALEFDELKRQAEEGRTIAQTYLAFRFLHGVGIPKDEAKAVYWFEKAAAAGDPASAFNLARLVKEGRVVLADPARALELFRIAVREGVPGARVELGEMLLTATGPERDFSEAAILFREAALLGNANAAFNLGVMHARGWGVAKNPAEALRWYERAAQGGEPNAQFNVAAAILAQNKSAEQAGRLVSLLSQAAAQGVPAAMFTLGRLYEEGGIVPANEVTAIRWYRAAIANGHEGAMSNLARMLIQRGLGAESDTEAVRLLETAAAKLDPSALFNLGALRQRGIIVARDPAAAKENYQLAAGFGFGPAQLALALMLTQSPSREEQVRAVAWGILAREQNAKLADDDVLDRLPDAVIAEGRYAAETMRREIERTRALREEGADVATVMLQRVRPAKASVNAFFISPDGAIVAPYSPIAGSSEIKIRFEGSLQPVTILAVDESRDIAVLSLGRTVGQWLPRSTAEPDDAVPLRGVWHHKPWEVLLESPRATPMRSVVSATPFGADREWLAVNSVWDSAAVGGALLDETGVVGVLSGQRALGGSVSGVANAGASEHGVALRASFINAVAARGGSPWAAPGAKPVRAEDVTAALVVVLGF